MTRELGMSALVSSGSKRPAGAGQSGTALSQLVSRLTDRVLQQLHVGDAEL